MTLGARDGHQRVNGPATVRFYVDADVLGLAKLIVQVRSDITYPGDPGGVVHRRQRPPCPIESPKVLDPDWIPEVAARGWLIITRDANIAVNRAEIAAVRDNGARMVALASKDARTTFDQLELLMIQWQAIEALVDEPGPFIYSATRTTLRSIDIAP